MRKTCTTFLLLLAITICHAATRDSASNNSLLWKISGNNLVKPSYLFGTIHLICPEDYFWTDTMSKYLQAADKVCFEMDLDDPKVLAEVMVAYSGLKGNIKAKTAMSAAQLKIIKSILRDSLNIDPDEALEASPLALQAMLLTKLIHCSSPESYEVHIMVSARNTGKEVLGLESAAEQMTVLSSIKSSTEGAELVAMLQSLSATRRLYDEILVDYISQDLPHLYTLMIASPEVKGSIDLLLNDRNSRWIGRMAPIMKKQSTFFAVGAGHLWGDRGVISLLRAAGYTATPLR